jgi:amino acid adenylation domain-containing protein
VDKNVSAEMTEEEIGVDNNNLNLIAIVGMSGRFPGANTVDQYWQNLTEGKCSFVPLKDEELRESGVPESMINDPNYVKVAYAVEDIELFDATLFQFTPREAEITDPQQRMLLECSYEALENAGYCPDNYDGLIGVYAGVGSMWYYMRNLTSNPEVMDSVGELRVSIGNEKSFASTMVSYKLNLQGPSVNVDTACSTSLVAIHQACQSLLSYECDMALSGGVCIDIPQKVGMLYKEGSIISPDGLCKPFDSDAKGSVKGNGAGIVVLKRLEDAIIDGDTIVAVIRGSAVNNDGSIKVGYTASSSEGQVEVIKEALQRAETDPRTIEYVEAHGTGTILGDPIEIDALSQVYGAATDAKGFCTIGSVKANIGHLDIAAGVAGLMKSALALNHKAIPPSINYTSPNPNIDFDNSAFLVNTEHRDWVKNQETPRRAAVSSFGIGGTNAHVVLEEPPLLESTESQRDSQLFVLSAKTKDALEGQIDNLARHLREQLDINLADAAHTLQVGRREYKHRAVVVGSNHTELADTLEQRNRALTLYSVQTESPNLYFLFPGQGAQHVTMAQDLYQQEAIFKENFDACADLFLKENDFDLRDIIFAEESEDICTRINSTFVAQCALFTVEYSMAKYWMHLGLVPEGMLGHSIGEYVAACLAEVMTLEDSITIIATRSRLMQSMPAGQMLMVALDEEQASEYLSDECSLAAVNGPEMCVLSGGREVLANIEEKLKAKDIDTRCLHTSHAFHSFMMEPILAEFKAKLSDIKLNAPTMPYMSNVSGDWVTAEQATDPQYWVEHLRGTVRFADGVNGILKDPDALLLEVGPGQVLTTLVKRSFGCKDKIVPSSRHAQDNRSDMSSLLNALGVLWSHGYKVDWQPLYSEERRLRIPMPTYAYDKKRFWINSIGTSETQLELKAKISKDEDSEKGINKQSSDIGDHLLMVWQQAFGLDDIDDTDNFFELGGDSLLATQLTSVICKKLNVNLALSEIFNTPVFGDFVQLVRDKAGYDATYTPTFPTIEPDFANKFEPFPLTDIQYAYWIGRSGGVELGDVSTHIYMEINLKKVDIERFNWAWNEMIKRHDMLRAVFLDSGEQRILETVRQYDFETFDLKGWDEEKAEEKQLAIREKMSHQILPADRWPLFDIKAAKHTESKYRLFLSIDVLIVDAHSMNMVIEQWLQLYYDPTLTFPDIGISFRDYVIAENNLRETDLFFNSEEYWFNRIESIPPAPDLPLAQSPSSIKDPTFSRKMYEMEEPRWSKLKEKIIAYGLTPTGLMVSAFSEVLALWCQNSSFTLNLTNYSRHPFHKDCDAIVGDFTSLTLLEVNNDQNESFLSNAQKVQKQLWSDLDNRFVSAIHLLREMGRRRGARVSMPVVFTSTLGARVMEQESAKSGELGEEVFGLSQTSQVWLDCQAYEWKGNLRYNFDAVEALFPEGMVQAMFETYSAFLESLVDDESAWGDLPLNHFLPEADKALIANSNQTEKDLSLDLLHRQFEKQAAKTPDNLAVIAKDKSLTYQQLHCHAQGVGHALRELQVGKGDIVGVMFDKGWQQVVSSYGILSAGGAYLALDPTLPKDRLQYILKNSGMNMLISNQLMLDKIGFSANGVQVIDINRIQAVSVDTPALQPVQTIDDLAYIIYTSGSTGSPKGVMVSHKGAANTIVEINNKMAVVETDCVFALSAHNFDLSVYDLFGTLCTGAAMVMPDPDLIREPAHWAALNREHKITVWNSVPALMQLYVDYAEENALSSNLRIAILSGDWIPPELPKRMQTQWPEIDVLGSGGPTETSIWNASHLVQPEDYNKESIPYGYPLANHKIHILNKQLKPCPVWVAGEMYVAGAGLFLGYMADQEKTDAVFITHPETGQRLYKSGDIGRYLPDGKMEILGRNDFQVKVNGYRIELGEVENALKQTGNFKDVVVIAEKAESGKVSNRLVAYVVPELSNNKSTTQEEQAKLVQFKLSKPGLRKAESSEKEKKLPSIKVNENVYKVRKSYRQYDGEQLTIEQLSETLGCFSEHNSADLTMPKYRYPSAGSLHPIQIYMYINKDGVKGLEEGFYYYHPVNHSITRLNTDDKLTPAYWGNGANPGIFASSAFSMLFVGQEKAIEPVYGKEQASSMMALEAGYMAQLLMEESTKNHIGLCPMGYLSPDVKQLMKLEDSQKILHFMVGGAITDEQINSWTGVIEEEHSADETDSDSSVEQIRRALKAVLPDYMVPGNYVVLDAMPLTTNGKVDRRSLTENNVSEPEDRDIVAPKNDIEQAILEIWKDALGKDDISVEDNFFESGGDSIMIVKIHQQLQAKLSSQLTVVELFQYPKITELADFLGAAPLDAPDIATVVETQVSKQKAALMKRRKMTKQGA